jgi:hypothetical protein
MDPRCVPGLTRADGVAAGPIIGPIGYEDAFVHCDRRFPAGHRGRRVSLADLGSWAVVRGDCPVRSGNPALDMSGLLTDSGANWFWGGREGCGCGARKGREREGTV